MLRFVKMEGCGNDYVFLDVGLGERVDVAALGPLPELARRVSDRHTGIGGDGLIVLDRGARAPVAMRMWNADGSEGKLCLNGLRCAALYAAETVAALGDHFALETASGERRVHVRRGAPGTGTVEVLLDAPEFRRERLPARGPGAELWGEAFPGPLGDLPGYGVSVGNPHLVLWLAAPRDVREAPLAGIGGPLSVDPRFPEGMNVHLAAAAAPDHLVTRPWERGTGMTLACGSGAVAVFAVARRLGRAAREARVEMPGGTVSMADGDDGTLRLTGPAREVFRATWGRELA